MKGNNIGKIYFSRQRKLLELKGELSGNISKPETNCKKKSKIQKVMIFAMVMAYLMIINAVVVPTN